jgi:hypothetical protein
VKRYAADRAVDGDTHTRWATEAEAKACWMEVDLGRAVTFDRAVILESGTSVKGFELQARDGEVWKTFHRGGTIGPECDIRFAPVTAQHVRLNILVEKAATNEKPQKPLQRPAAANPQFRR